MALPRGVVMIAEEKSTRDKTRTHEFDVTNWIQTKTEFSCAIAVMDRIGGWIKGGNIEGESKIG